MLFKLRLKKPSAYYPLSCHVTNHVNRPPFCLSSDWRFHPLNKAWSHKAYWFQHFALQASLQLDTPSNFLSGLGTKLMLWPPNAWKHGGRQKLLPHVRKASDAQVLAEFLSNGLHDELGLGSSGGENGQGERQQFCSRCGCPGHNRWTPYSHPCHHQASSLTIWSLSPSSGQGANTPTWVKRF